MGLHYAAVPFFLLYIVRDIIITMTEQHLALYRKYRPQTFDDVVGQEQLVTLLQSAIKQKKMSHAYLFCGGRGTGKTTVARIFAHDIGCNPEDIIEIDAASNRGIDEIRELRDAVRTSPFSSPYKVYIIDEVHMLTKEAANALLKTLEEPPSHVIFILATTDPEKLPSTIISRCQKIIFRSPDLVTLANRLQFVAEQEGKNLELDASLLLARHGKGSYRDALGMLEQVLTTSGKTVKLDDVVSQLGTPEKSTLLELLRAFCAHDERAIVGSISVLQKSNTSAIRAYDEFLDLVRQGLLIRIGESDSKETELKALSVEFATIISSKLILMLLEQRHLLEVSDVHAWSAFLAILLPTTSE
jgi:DNA polymerase-3 subunit gamma/tau